jgi:hypothetical protein
LSQYITNDGDLTCVFYDPPNRSAFLTAFLGKEYPVLIPIPGYDDPEPEEKSAKILHAAQSPSGSRFAIVNSMTEIHVFTYKQNGKLNNRKLKKSCTKIPSSSFKRGQMVLSMPQDNTLLVFWAKETKLVLRKIKIDDETYSDYDVRPEYEYLTQERSMILPSSPEDSRRPSHVPPSSCIIAELPTSAVPPFASITEMQDMESIQALETRRR